MSANDQLPTVTRPAHAVARRRMRQSLNLSVAVGGTLGGAVLLASNIAAAVANGVSAIPWIGLSANVALLFGGLMFAREYRRGRR